MTFSRKQQQRDVAVLKLLCALPTHPYDLNRQLLAMGAWWSRKGGVNQRLKRLHAEGLVTSSWEIPAHGRLRLLYIITEAGVAYLQRTRGGVSPRRYWQAGVPSRWRAVWQQDVVRRAGVSLPLGI